MVDFVMTTPLQDESVTRTPMQLLTKLLSEVIKKNKKSRYIFDVKFYEIRLSEANLVICAKIIEFV